jgi:hypothetical protein
MEAFKQEVEAIMDDSPSEACMIERALSTPLQMVKGCVEKGFGPGAARDNYGLYRFCSRGSTALHACRWDLWRVVFLLVCRACGVTMTMRMRRLEMCSKVRCWR